MTRRRYIMAAAWLAAAWAARATLITSQTDTDGAGATVNGVISANEYGPGNSYAYTGGGTGFGGNQLGNSTLLVNSDAAYLYFAFTNISTNNDANQYLLYLHTRAGGFQTSGGEMTDFADQGRRNTSVLSTNGSESMTFEESGVSNKADFTLCFNNRNTNTSGFSALFELRGASESHGIVTHLRAGLGTSNVEFRVPRSSLGLGTNDTVDFATFEVSGTGYMADGGHPRNTTNEIGFGVGQTNLFRDFHRFTLAPSTQAGLTQRVANTTLSLPQTAPVSETASYSTTNAFPGLTFVNPLVITAPPGETNRLFVVEQDGRILVITNLAAPTVSVFMDISNKVVFTSGDDERGLLGLAFHPGYATNGYFFVYYNTLSGGQSDRIARYQVSGDPNVADTNSEVLLISQLDDCGNHNGGDVHFGPDGYLYVSLGDEGGGDDDCNGGNSQRVDKDFFSGILRIDVDKKPGSLAPNPHAAIVAPTNYAIPPDNPWVGVTNFNGSNLVAAAVRTEFWAVGLRNPYRMSFDEVTGELYVGDVGQGAREEVDLIQKGGNYGWKYREGFLSNPNVPAPPAGFTNPINPILDYPRSDGSVITGGRVYRGDRFPELVGRYIFTDYGSGNIWSLTNNGTNVTTKTLLAIDAPIAGFGKDPRNGDLLLAHRGADQIKRLERALTSTNFPQTLSAAGVFADLGSLIPYAGIVPFDINVPFWSDNAIKSRWFSLPNTNLTFTFNREASWVSPTTTVWIKHFDLLLTSGVPASARRVETRLLVKNDDGNGGYGVTYRWGTSTSDAALVLGAGQDEEFVINDGGTIRTQVWHYPSRSECLTCHKTVAGFALGFNTPQMNKSFSFGPPSTNQIMALSDAGYFSSPVTNYHTLRSLASAGDTAVSLEYRVRSYFQANCGQCHLPGGGTPVAWDARVFTPVSQANIINGDVTGPEPWRFISPGQTTNSMALARISIRGDFQMPPLASSVVDTGAVALVASWINALAGYQSFSEWQVFHFGSSNAPGTGAEEDFDGDGALNNLEYLTGTHPTNGLDAWTVAGVSISNHIPQVLFDRVANRGFDVQVNTNLLDGGWQSLDVPGNAPFFGITPQGVTVGDVTTNGALEQRNYRVRVYEP